MTAQDAAIMMNSNDAFVIDNQLIYCKSVTTSFLSALLVSA